MPVSRNRACAARNRQAAGKLFFDLAKVPANRRAPARRPRTAGGMRPCVRCASLARMRKTRRFLQGGVRAGKKPWRRQRIQVRSGAANAASSSAPPRFETGTGLLTVEKTVIRFRPKQKVPAETSEPNQRDKRQHNTDLRPDDRQGGRRLRFPRKNASTATAHHPWRPTPRVFYCPRAWRRACRIRPGARRAPAVGRGSDSRGVASNWAVLAKQVH